MKYLNYLILFIFAALALRAEEPIYVTAERSNRVVAELRIIGLSPDSVNCAVFGADSLLIDGSTIEKTANSVKFKPLHKGESYFLVLTPATEKPLQTIHTMSITGEKNIIRQHLGKIADPLAIVTCNIPADYATNKFDRSRSISGALEIFELPPVDFSEK